MRALLDVNVLIALLDDAHVHHGRARDWLGEHIGDGWASCAITQLGCLRIMSNARYPSPRPTATIAQRLAAAARTPHHEFWEARVDPLGSAAIDWSLLLSPRHTTDVYLLALAVAQRGRLVTFDPNVPWRAVRGAEPGHYVTVE